MSAYRSTLPKRTRPVEQSDFAGLEDRLVLDGLKPGQGFLNHTLDRWDEHIPFYPADVVRLLTNDFSDDIGVRIALFAEQFELKIHSRVAQSFDSSIIFSQNDTDKFSIKVSPECQKKGIGRMLMGAVIELSMALGQPSLNFSGGLTNGCYTWSKMGANLDMSYKTEESRDMLLCEIVSRLNAAKDVIKPSEAYDKAMSYAHLVKKDDLRNLVNIDATISDDVFNDPLYRTTYPIAATTLKKSFEHAMEQGTRFTLGRYLLCNCHVPMVIDYADVAQMETIGNYLGGWKTIERVPNPQPKAVLALNA